MTNSEKIATEQRGAEQLTVTGERADLLASLRRHRYFLSYTVRDLTEEQAAARPTVSALCLGGLIRHVAETEAAWIRFALGEPESKAARPKARRRPQGRRRKVNRANGDRGPQGRRSKGCQWSVPRGTGHEHVEDGSGQPWKSETFGGVRAGLPGRRSRKPTHPPELAPTGENVERAKG